MKAIFGVWRLAPFADSLWTASTPVRFGGMRLPHVMTVLRLNDGNLLLHSPCEPSAALFDEIARIGNVAHVVAPNWFHDLYLNEYRSKYSEATFWAPRVLARQLPKVINCVLDQNARPPWLDIMPHVTLPGLLTFDETIFYYSPSQTMIVADLFTNLFAGPDAPAFTRFAYRLSRIEGRVTMLPYLRWFGFMVRASLRKAARQILEWNPDRLIVGHGMPTANNASAQLKEVCENLLR